MKRLWYNADTEMISVSSSITLNLRSKSFVFNICTCAVLAQSIQYIIAIIVPLPKRHTCIKLRDHQLYEDCTVSFLGCYEVEKRIEV